MILVDVSFRFDPILIFFVIMYFSFNLDQRQMIKHFVTDLAIFIRNLFFNEAVIFRPNYQPLIDLLV